MTDEDRKWLVEAMALELAQWKWGRGSQPSEREVEWMGHALDAAERAGFAWSAGWRPIESAPRNGRTTPLCKFHEIIGRDDVGRVAAIAWGEASELWLDANGDEFYPTHWMPLLPLPKDKP